MMDKKYECPCCGQMTLNTQGEDEICPVCYYTDDRTVPDNVTAFDNYFTLNESRKLWNKYHKSMLEIARLRSYGGTIGDEIVGTEVGKWPIA